MEDEERIENDIAEDTREEYESIKDLEEGKGDEKSEINDVAEDNREETESIEDLKRMLMIENKYDRFSMFKVNVLNKAIDEINKYTDVSVSYELIRENRIITKIKFDVFRSITNERITERNRQIKLGVIDDE